MCRASKAIWEPISSRVYERIIEIQWKYFYVHHNCNNLIRSQIGTCHDYSAVMIFVKLRPDIIIIFQVIATLILTRFGYWAHKLPVKWVSEHHYMRDSYCLMHEISQPYHMQADHLFLPASLLSPHGRKSAYHLEGSFRVWTPPMREGVT